jgi:hypothetical protein
MESNWEDYDFDVTIDVDGVKYDIGAKITSKGTIFLDSEDEWSTDPVGYPAVKVGSYITNSAVDEVPEWEIRWIDVYENGDITELRNEDISSYFTLNPGRREYIYNWIEEYCRTNLAEDAIDHGESDYAYDVHVKEEDDDYYDGPDTYWERDN